MKIIESISELDQIPEGTVLTIGNFDGFHIGHKKIFDTAKQIAADKAVAMVAMTFDPHPVRFLFPDKAPGTLTPLVLKKHLIEQSGADFFAVLKSCNELLKLSAEDFVSKIISGPLRPGTIVEGDDFNFGAKRSGSVETLAELLKDTETEVIVVKSIHAEVTADNSIEVSSTMIRRFITEGDMHAAAIELGRPYKLLGSITSGRGIGKKIGFPTINMAIPDQLIPAEGVYAGKVSLAENSEGILTNADIPAVFSIGRTQTLSDDCPLLIEAHLFTENIPTGKFIGMDFFDFIRPQEKFDHKADLAAQIAKDCEKAREVLGKSVT